MLSMFGDRSVELGTDVACGIHRRWEAPFLTRGVSSSKLYNKWFAQGVSSEHQ